MPASLPDERIVGRRGKTCIDLYQTCDKLFLRLPSLPREAIAGASGGPCGIDGEASLIPRTDIQIMQLRVYLEIA